MTVAELPEMLKVEEAAQVLRISRSSAYEGINLFQATSGTEGIPSVRIGRSLRVPKRALLAWIDEMAGHEGAIGPADAA